MVGDGFWDHISANVFPLHTDCLAAYNPSPDHKQTPESFWYQNVVPCLVILHSYIFAKFLLIYLIVYLIKQ